MNNAIALFLSSPFSYNTGLQLLMEILPDNQHVKQMAKGFSMNNKHRMLKMLQENLNTFVSKNAITQTIVPTYIKNQKQTTEEVFSKNVSQDVSQKVMELKQERNKLFSQASYVHNELNQLTLNQKEREMRAKLIVENFERTQAIWDALDYFEQYGTLPLSFTDKKVEHKTAIETHNRINNLRSYLTKHKKNLLIAKTEKQRLKLEDSIARMEFELKGLLNAH